MKKADFIIITFVFILISVAYSATFFRKSEDFGAELNIYVDGKLEYSYPLPLYEKKEIELNSKYGYNKIIADKTSVYVEKADCGGNDCVNSGEIMRNGEFIICVPHRLIIRIENEKAEGYDAISY